MASLQPFRRFRTKANSAHDIYSSQADSLPTEASRSTTSISPSMTSADDGRPNTAFRQDPSAHKRVANDSQPVAVDFQDRHHDKNTARRPPQNSDPPQATVSSSFEMSSDEEDHHSAPPDIRNRAIHIPVRTTSMEGAKRNFSRPKSQDCSASFASQRSIPPTPESHDRGSGGSAGKSSADSVMSYETNATSIGTIPPLQTKGASEENDRLEPLEEDDPGCFDLVAPAENENDFSLEKRSEKIFSREHLQAIFSDPALLNKFTSFLSAYRPKSIPLLIYYLDALKALRAINYANAVAEALEPIDNLEFTSHPARPTINSVLEEKAQRAFDQLVRDDLPAYVSHIWVQVVSMSIQMRITGTLPPHLRETSEGLAETFCLTDPSRKDNPIIFASEEFHRTTQYGVSYAIGRNCRFLQGPRTNEACVQRLSQALKEGKEISEVLLNYRRDGSTFMNLLMMAPLMDNKGKVRYFIGSQVDVSGLAKECADLPALKRMLAREGEIPIEEAENHKEEEKDEFQTLCEMFNQHEVETVRKTGGRMHREQVEDDDAASTFHQPRLLLKDASPPLGAHSEVFGKVKNNGKLAGIYSHYLLVRPYPSLRILFTSPSLRVPGILQSGFMDRIGGSSRVREELEQAMAVGRGVTAKVRWLTSSRPDDEGRSRWIHCTPLLGQNGSVGVWMVVLVDDHGGMASRRWRAAPPVSREIGSRRGHAEDRITNGANRSELRSPEGLVPPARARKNIAPIETKGHSKFDRTLTEEEFDRQMAERDRFLGLASPRSPRSPHSPRSPRSPRSPQVYVDRMGNASPRPPGSASNSLDSFRI